MLNIKFVQKCIKYTAMVIVIHLMTTNLLAQDGGYPGAFLRIGTGGHAQGLGGAYVAVVNNATAGYWNPAGLNQLSSIEFSSTYSKLPLNRMYNNVAFAIPFAGPNRFGFNWINYTINDIDERNMFGEKIGSFSNNQNAFIFSYSTQIVPSLSIGSNIKYLSNSLYDSRATGVGYDAGIHLKIGKHLSFAYCLQNIKTYIKWNTKSNHKEKYPMIHRTGLAFQIPTVPILLSYDYENNSYQKQKMHFGLEFQLENVPLRMGINDRRIAFGAGLKLPIAFAESTFDYGLYADQVGSSFAHQMSLNLKLNRPKNNVPVTTPTFDELFNEPQMDLLKFIQVLRCQIEQIRGDIIAIDIGRNENIKEGQICKVIIQKTTGIEKVIGYFQFVKVINRYSTMKPILNIDIRGFQKGDDLILLF